MSYFPKTKDNTDISHKMIPDTDLSSSVWNKVYFGKYKGTPMLWRIISKKSREFGSTANYDAFFLDCDTILEKRQFTILDKNLAWVNSALRNYLNGSFTENFSGSELDAVNNCVTPIDKLSRPKTGPQFDSLYSDKFFVPDVSELPGLLSDTKYPKRKDAHSLPQIYWLRSYCPDGKKEKLAAAICPDLNSKPYKPTLEYYDKKDTLGVSPACVLKQSSFMLSTKVASNTYKLTLVDSDSGSGIIFVPADKKVKYNNGKVTIPYIVSHASMAYNAISIMILDKVYEARKDNSDAKLLHYELIKNPDNFSRNGTASFNSFLKFLIDSIRSILIFSYGKLFNI